MWNYNVIKKDKILEFNSYMKSDKISYIIYADIESLIRKIDGCANNPENYLTTKVGEHITCEYSMSTMSCLTIQKTDISYIVEKTV